MTYLQTLIQKARVQISAKYVKRQLAIVDEAKEEGSPLTKKQQKAWRDKMRSGFPPEDYPT